VNEKGKDRRKRGLLIPYINPITQPMGGGGGVRLRFLTTSKKNLGKRGASRQYKVYGERIASWIKNKAPPGGKDVTETKGLIGGRNEKGRTTELTVD